jgi:hypothetical protein
MDNEDPATEETREPRWFSVAGVALLMTALVLLAGDLDRTAAHSAGISLALLFTAAAAMFGVGLFLEKLGHHSPALVMTAGGLASFYFVAFAGYYFPHLRLIDHPTAGCAITIAVAVLVVLVAERRKTPLATFLVVILSGYTTALQPVLWFTLFSDVILVGAACWLLMRHGRVLLAFITLVASYLSYAMWWSYHNGRLDPARYLPLHEFWQTCLLFAACWLTVVAGVSLTRRDKLAPGTRLLLFSLNHALFFSLVVFVLPPMHSEWISTFSLGFGAAMIGAAALARRREPSIWPPAFQQGALVMALGLFTAAAGPHPVLVVAIVSALLLVTGRALDERWGNALRFCAEIVASFAFLMALTPICHPARAGRMIGAITGLILIGSACVNRRLASSRPVIDWHAVYFAALGMALWLITVIYQSPQIHQPPLLAIVALALTASILVLRVPELPYLAKGLVLAALVLWLAQIGNFERSWWNPAVVILITLALSRWWQTRGAHLIPRWELILVQVVAALGVVAILFFWLEGSLTPSWWLVVASALSVTSLIYGILTRDWTIAALGQAFTLASLYEFCAQLAQSPPPSWVFALMPVAMFLSLAHASERARSFVVFEWIATLFHALAVLTFIGWIMTYLAADWRFICLEVLGFALLLWARVQQKKSIMFGSLAFTSAAVLVAWIGDAGARGFHLQDLVAFALLLGQQQLSKPLLPSPDLQNLAMTLGITTLWRWVSLWSAWHFGAMSLTIAWALLGLVVYFIGVFFREQMYRWLGWGLLISATLRVLLVDTHYPGAVVVFHFAVVGSAVLVAAFSDRALFARLLGEGRPGA